MTEAANAMIAPTRARPIARRTMHDEIVECVRDMIIEGQLPPGARIHEGQLGKLLGISRTPLREALKFLASEGLLELVPGRGAVVKKFGAAELRDMLQVLSALETLAARQTCANAADADIAGLRAVHDEMMRHYARGDRLDYYKCNQAIHTRLVALSGNAFLAATHEGIQSRLRRIRFVGHEGAEKWADAVAEHEALIAAIEARDVDRVATIVAKHLDNTWERVRDIV